MLERKERKNVGQIECEYSDLKTGKMPGRMSKKMSDSMSDNISGRTRDFMSRYMQQ